MTGKETNPSVAKKVNGFRASHVNIHNRRTGLWQENRYIP